MNTLLSGLSSLYRFVAVTTIGLTALAVLLMGLLGAGVHTMALQVFAVVFGLFAIVMLAARAAQRGNNRRITRQVMSGFALLSIIAAILGGIMALALAGAFLAESLRAGGFGAAAPDFLALFDSTTAKVTLGLWLTIGTFGLVALGMRRS